MAIQSASDGNFRIGGVISSTFSIIGRNFATFFSLSLLAEVPGAAFGLIANRAIVFARGPALLLSPYAYFEIVFLGLLVYYVLNSVLQGALAQGTLAHLNGQRASFVDCSATGLKSFFPLSAIAILGALGTLGGMLLLVLPGIILWIGWSVVIPVRVVEHKSIFGAFARSWRLTAGYPGAIFALYLVLFVGSLLLRVPLVMLQWVTLPIVGTWEGQSINIAGAGLVDSLAAMFGATMTGVIYYQLRAIKEGIGPEALAAVFD